jgi:hypothetical protein
VPRAIRVGDAEITRKATSTTWCPSCWPAHFVIAAWPELTAHDRDLVEHRKAC